MKRRMCHNQKKFGISAFGQLLDDVKAACGTTIKFNDELQRDLPKKWEKHGDMVILPQNCFRNKQWFLLGPALWATVAKSLQANRVGRKRDIEDDPYRTPLIELKFGKNGWVEHFDKDLIYEYDVTKCMFSIGNVKEKARVSQFDCHNECVVDLFAGIGYYSLPLLLHANAKSLVAIEWNEDKIEALKRNAKRNNVEERMIIIEGDARKVAPCGMADRVILAMLPSAKPHWLTGCRCLKATGGKLHIHEIISLEAQKKNTQEIMDVIKKLREENNLKRKSKQTIGTLVDCGVDSSTSNIEDSTRRLERSDSGVSINGEDTDLMGESIDDKDEVIVKERKPRLNSRAASIIQEIENRKQAPVRVSEELFNTGRWRQLHAETRNFAISCAQACTKFMSNLHELENQSYVTIILDISKVKSYSKTMEHIVVDLHCYAESNTNISFDEMANWNDT